MTIDIAAIAADYTAAWNSGSAEAVASFYAPDGNIVINRGTPWEGRAGIAAMAAGFFADVPDLSLACDGLRIAGDHVACAANPRSARHRQDAGQRPRDPVACRGGPATRVLRR